MFELYKITCAQNTDLHKGLKDLNTVLLTEVITLVVIVHLHGLFR
jgi:hypothetical protein